MKITDEMVEAAVQAFYAGDRPRSLDNWRAALAAVASLIAADETNSVANFCEANAATLDGPDRFDESSTTATIRRVKAEWYRNLADIIRARGTP